MARGWPIELRTRNLEASVSGRWKEREVAEIFGVSLSTVQRLGSRHRHGESLEPGRSTGAPRKLGPSALRWLQRWLRQSPYTSSYELTKTFNQAHRHGPVHRSTILRAMHDLGYRYHTHRSLRRTASLEFTKHALSWLGNRIDWSPKI